jgi:outer membrane protein assembly factor BamD (BamD/ComL family)
LAPWRFVFLLLLNLACPKPPPPADVVKGERLFGRAEELERAQDWSAAAKEYERVAAVERSTRGREPARALVRAAQIRAERLQEPVRAAADCWRAIVSYPDAAPADDAVRELVRLRPPRLREDLLATARELDRTEVADNLRFEAARLLETENPAQARLELESLAHDYPQSGLRDDALWRAAGIARTAGDTDGALEDLRIITAKRRDAMFVGSFNSAFMDDAQLLKGQIWLEDKHDVAKAVLAFELLRDDMPDSTLRDDAQMWIAKAYAQGKDPARACAALARLRKDYPDSRYLRRGGPELSAELGCK